MSVLVPAAATVADEDVVAMIQRRVRDWQPTRDERLLDQVGWAGDLVEAKRLAKEHGRPLFVFTYSGSTTELNDLSQNRIDERSLKLKVLSVEKDRVRARIEGRLKMKHAFYPGRDDNNVVNATLIGLLEFDPSKPQIHSLQIVTDQATYGGSVNGSHPFGVAVRLVP